MSPWLWAGLQYNVPLTVRRTRVQCPPDCEQDYSTMSPWLWAGLEYNVTLTVSRTTVQCPPNCEQDYSTITPWLLAGLNYPKTQLWAYSADPWPWARPPSWGRHPPGAGGRGSASSPWSWPSSSPCSRTTGHTWHNTTIITPPVADAQFLETFSK